MTLDTRTMTTFEIGKKYVELCEKLLNDVALVTLYSPDLVSIEIPGVAGEPRETRGLKLAFENGKQFMRDHIIHKAVLQGPWPNGDCFIVRFLYDLTNKPSGHRIQLDETGLFTVENGKIVREEFFYLSPLRPALAPSSRTDDDFALIDTFDLVDTFDLIDTFDRDRGATGDVNRGVPIARELR